MSTFRFSKASARGPKTLWIVFLGALSLTLLIIIFSRRGREDRGASSFPEIPAFLKPASGTPFAFYFNGSIPASGAHPPFGALSTWFAPVVFKDSFTSKETFYGSQKNG
jgi:hypothetical protein